MKDEVSESMSKRKLLNLPTSSKPSIEENNTYLGQEVPSSTSGNMFLICYVLYNYVYI